jgi:hypothetical protein
MKTKHTYQVRSPDRRARMVPLCNRSHIHLYDPYAGNRLAKSFDRHKLGEAPWRTSARSLISGVAGMLSYSEQRWTLQIYADGACVDAPWPGLLGLARHAPPSWVPSIFFCQGPSPDATDRWCWRGVQQERMSCSLHARPHGVIDGSGAISAIWDVYLDYHPACLSAFALDLFARKWLGCSRLYVGIDEIYQLVRSWC